MIYPSTNISKRDWAMQKERKKRERHAQKHDQKEREREIVHVSKISKRRKGGSCEKEFQ